MANESSFLIDLILGGLTVTLGFILIGYFFSRLLRRNDIADILWGLGFLAQGIWAGWESLKSGVPSMDLRKSLTFIFLILWALRLSIYLGFRILKYSKGEDIRYANWRKDWGASEPFQAFIRVFVLQGFLMFIISLPLIWVLGTPTKAELSPWDFIGTGLFIVGFLMESVADYELFRFKQTSPQKGQLLQWGLWKYCRHPNYLGEILVWWGFFALAFSLQGGPLTIISPLLISFLLLKVSGVPMLDKILAQKGTSFAEYILSTPAIFPLRKHDLMTLLLMILMIPTLDFIWLGILFKDFYQNELGILSRLNHPGGNFILWAAGGVYILMASGLKFFAVKPGDSQQSLFRGALLGLCIYGIYDLTNLSLLEKWPISMSLLDIAWGSLLCGIVSWAGALINSPKKGPA